QFDLSRQTNLVIDETQNGQVAARVGRVDVGVTAALAGEADVNLGGIVNHVVIGQDQAFGSIDDHPAAISFRHVPPVGQIVPACLVLGRALRTVHAPLPAERPLRLRYGAAVSAEVEATQFARIIGGRLLAEEFLIDVAPRDQDAGDGRFRFLNG